MDPLSDILALLKVRSFVSGRLEIGGRWSFGFGPHEGIKFQAITRGEGWLVVQGEAPVRIRAGDCFLLPRGRPFHMTCDLDLPPVDAMSLIPANRDASGLTRMQGGDDFHSFGGYFDLDGDHAGLLLAELPAVVHVRGEADRADLRWCLERMRREMIQAQPGGALVGQQLAMMVLVQALRLHLEDRIAQAKARGAGSGAGAGAAGDAPGWLTALADPQVAAALGALHAEPARRWTLEALAAQAAMSRTVLATRFKALVGAAPMAYLARWRMTLAASRLADGAESVGAIALSLGYESESAFSTAFKRHMGRAPRAWARGRALAA
ncbi:AraC family transcriptional regulator [Caulobacter sp. KR2-114]|uniref:AraC family transcriptional regulator n=1 Tax=Caulobacter sp. KR2-114 TaxID=3400912 RepID=UPI003BFDB7F0